MAIDSSLLAASACDDRGKHSDNTAPDPSVLAAESVELPSASALVPATMESRSHMSLRHTGPTDHACAHTASRSRIGVAAHMYTWTKVCRSVTATDY